MVIDRKITRGTRSDWGDRWQERIWSVLSTCVQTGRDVLLFLRESVAALFASLLEQRLDKTDVSGRGSVRLQTIGESCRALFRESVRSLVVWIVGTS